MANAHCSTSQTCIKMHTHASMHGPFQGLCIFVCVSPSFYLCLAIACGDCKLHSVYYPLLYNMIIDPCMQMHLGLCHPFRKGGKDPQLSIIHAFVW